MAQLHLTQSFVNDLLDLGQLKNGVFALTKVAFQPSESFEMVVNIFSPQAAAKGVHLLWQIDSEMDFIQPFDPKAPSSPNFN